MVHVGDAMCAQVSSCQITELQGPDPCKDSIYAQQMPVCFSGRFLWVLTDMLLRVVCRRRRNQAPFADQILSSAPPLTGRSTSPDTERFMSRTLSSLEDDSNK